MSEVSTTKRAPQQTRRPPPPPGTPIVVEVYARDGVGGEIDFSHSWRWEDGTPGGGDQIDIPPKKKDEPGTEITFKLFDKTNPRRGLKFAEDSHGGPMWVDRRECPPEDTKCEDPEIPVSKMERRSTNLTVVDENKEECILHYRLRFRDQVNRPESYDPDIKNGGST